MKFFSVNRREVVWVSTIPGLWTEDWTLDWSMDSQLLGLCSIDFFVILASYCHADLHSFLIQDAPQLNNNIYDKHLMKSFHGADVNDDSD